MKRCTYWRPFWRSEGAVTTATCQRPPPQRSISYRHLGRWPWRGQVGGRSQRSDKVSVAYNTGPKAREVGDREQEQGKAQGPILRALAGRGDEVEGSLPQGGANRRLRRFAPAAPGKSRVQRMPSGRLTAQPLDGAEPRGPTPGGDAPDSAPGSEIQRRKDSLGRFPCAASWAISARAMQHRSSRPG